MNPSSLTQTAPRHVAEQSDLPTKRHSTQLMTASATGFVVGAACWHMIGFWGFVREAVFYSPSTTQIARAVPLAKSQARPFAASSAAVVQSTCANAAPSSTPEGVRITPCQTVIKFRPSRDIARGDRGDFGPTPVPTLISASPGKTDLQTGTAVSGWEARVAPQTSSQD